MVSFSIPCSLDLVRAESLPKGGLNKPKGTVDDEMRCIFRLSTRATKTNACDSRIGLELDGGSLLSYLDHWSSVVALNGRRDVFLFKSLCRSLRICGDWPVSSFPSVVALALAESRC